MSTTFVIRWQGMNQMFKITLLFILLISIIVPVKALLDDEDMTADFVCPCECSMIITTCDCPTAMQIKDEIIHMKESGFSEKQIFKAFQAEYGKEMLANPEKTDSTALWVAGISIFLILTFLLYLAGRKVNPEIIPAVNNKQYEKQFKEEYQKFVTELEEP